MSEEPVILKVWERRGNRAVTVTKLLPEDWKYVLATVLEKTDDYVIIKFRRLTPTEAE